MKTASPLLCALLFTAAALYGTPAPAAGMTTHALMADYGRQALPDGPLKQILSAHRPSLVAGAIYPDGGYGSGAAFPEDRDMAERAHWGEFHIAFMRHLRERGCGAQAARLLNLPAPVTPPGSVVENPVGAADLAGLTNECGRLIAFAFGTAAHGVTDETWDAQFEPEVRDRGEDPNVSNALDAEGLWGPFTPGSTLRAALGDNYHYLSDLWAATPMNAIEYAMDVIAIVEHRLWDRAPTLVFPPTTDLMAVYTRSGAPVSAAQIERGNAFSRGAVEAQTLTAQIDYPRVRSHMPWSANNYFLNAGGVVSSGRVVAAMYQNMWAQLTGPADQVLTPRVAGHYPSHGAHEVQLRPNDGGWTQHRWMHVFFDAEVDPQSIEQPGAFALYDEDGKRIDVTVEGGHGWSRFWSHSTRLRLNEVLRANHRYTAVLTPKVADWNGQPLARPYVWEFVTAP